MFKVALKIWYGGFQGKSLTHTCYCPWWAVGMSLCNGRCVFVCLVLAVGTTPALAKLWSLAGLCTVSACGVAYLLPVCVRGSLAWFIGPRHAALRTPPLLLEWLSHVLVVDLPGWFSTDGGQMWPCSQAPGAQGNMPCRQCGEKGFQEMFLTETVSLFSVCSNICTRIWSCPL